MSGNRLRGLEFDQQFERRGLYAPGLPAVRRPARSSATLVLTLDLNEATAEKLIAACASLAAGKPRHEPISLSDLKLPQVLAILVSELGES